jgi:GAF domain-containing protein
MALGRKSSAEPLSSEDMALLAAVAAQAATALENGRLYRQLTVKADELERMREFSENILESLNDGLAVVDRDDRVVGGIAGSRFRRRHEDAVGRRWSRSSIRASGSCDRVGASRPTARRSTACRSLRGTPGTACS